MRKKLKLVLHKNNRKKDKTSQTSPFTYVDENGMTITRYPARYAKGALRQEDTIWHWPSED
jgi:hypothetical protein